MNRTVLLLVGLLAATATLVPTGAFQALGTDEAPALRNIEMAPAEGSNGKDALLNGDDEIALLLTGANPNLEGAGVSQNAVTPIRNVFTITYTGDRRADVWLTDDAEDIRFVRGEGRPTPLEGRENNVTLGPG